ncbi:MAG TPA: hypothetical protein PK175_10620 [Syntrophales bacterium]|nr:hypothetical protein [Syntrophales bacterium]HON22702.1 hypothetical protein [Syntrophales bacterium]HOU76848.1 hypothetical protein [Syntrophales bacterium]HPC31617.1 hypothetical protein [Syntrophales bacterium]HQG35316.1 hypothetical protein [Syntrophales bacterium]
MAKKKVLISWSSGKDCAWALHLLRRRPELEVAGLFTTVNENYDRVFMHDTRRELLARQAAAAGLPLQTIGLPDVCPNEQYEAALGRFVAASLAAGIGAVAFGDIFLTDLRAYRERQLAGTGMEALFPLWGLDTAALAEEMLAAGVSALITSVDLKKLPADFAGRLWSRELIAAFPPSCDPCGENGEIHTVVVGGPMFQRSIPVRTGEIVVRDGFAYADVLPDDDVPVIPG